jgi:hypothetical protein
VHFIQRFPAGHDNREDRRLSIYCKFRPPPPSIATPRPADSAPDSAPLCAPYVGMELGWDLITGAIDQIPQDDQKEREAHAAENEKAEKDAHAERQKELAEIQKTKEKLNAVQSSRNSGLMFGGFLVTFVGVLFLLTWLPWSMVACLDPEEKTSGVQSAIRRGREIAAGNLWPIVGVYIIVTVIAGVSSAACLLPGLFFGIPLALAMVPGLYLCLRGELEHIDT